MTDFDAAETAIRQLHARIVDAVWRKDPVAFGDCYTEDAEWRIAGMVLRGRPEIAGAFERLMGNCQRVLMTFRTPILEVGDGTASGRTYVSEQNAFKSGRPGSTMGVYFERFVDQGDRWRCAWRLFQLHYIGPPDLTGSFFEHPDYGPPPGMPDPDAVPGNYSGLGFR
jgi:ketosteroid isomerase-like protein